MEDYKVFEILGKGAFGCVRKAIRKRKYNEEDDFYAIKEVTDDECHGISITTLREISILRQLEHQNIVKLFDVIIQQPNGNCCLIFEYCPYDLHQFMNCKYKNGIELNILRKFMGQLLDGITWCHKKLIFHRDLKPQNILVSQDDMTIKISDFGLCRTFTVPFEAYTHEVVTLWYRCPEILLGTDVYTNSVDMWSIGCIMGEMTTNIPMFAGDSEISQLFNIFEILGTPTNDTWKNVTHLKDFTADFPKWSKNKQYFDVNMQNLGEHGNDLLACLLTYDPTLRITGEESQKHVFFTEKTKWSESNAWV